MNRELCFSPGGEELTRRRVCSRTIRGDADKQSHVKPGHVTKLRPTVAEWSRVILLLQRT